MTQLSPQSSSLLSSPRGGVAAGGGAAVITPLRPPGTAEEGTEWSQPEGVDLELAPPALLASLGKDPRLTPYGGGNFGMPLAWLEPEGPLIVPTERFFLRSNGPVPILDPATWHLSVTGHVARPLALRLADLAAMPQRRLVAFLECAGNGRTRFEPLPPGTPWGNDAAGNAVWEGVPLAHLLDLAGVREEAVDVVSQGGTLRRCVAGCHSPWHGIRTRSWCCA
jgi:hypothetical protein